MTEVTQAKAVTEPKIEPDGQAKATLPGGIKTPPPETAEQMRNRYRQGLVGNTPKADRKRCTLFGYDVELKQPSLDVIVGTELQGTTKDKLVHFIIQFTVLPGTDVQVFEEMDKPQILKWPFGPDFVEFQNMINELMAIDITAEEEALQKDPLAEQS